MEFILLAVIVLQFGFLIYSDIQNRKEREMLELKLMSEDLNEYKAVLEDTPEDAKSEPDPYVSVDEVGVEQLLKTKEKR